VGEAILTDDGVKELSLIPNLSVLFVNNQRITNKSLSYIADMPNLTELDFQGTNPAGKFADFKKLKKLKLLSLGNIVLTESDIKDLEQLKSLDRLRMSETNLTEAQARELVRVLPNLTTVNFAGCPQIYTEVNQELIRVAMKRRNLEPGR
jgi:Leucine-rich repeat (LRR) protein